MPSTPANDSAYIAKVITSSCRWLSSRMAHRLSASGVVVVVPRDYCLASCIERQDSFAWCGKCLPQIRAFYYPARRSNAKHAQLRPLITGLVDTTPCGAWHTGPSARSRSDTKHERIVSRIAGGNCTTSRQNPAASISSCLSMPVMAGIDRLEVTIHLTDGRVLCGSNALSGIDADTSTTCSVLRGKSAQEGSV